MALLPAVTWHGTSRNDQECHLRTAAGLGGAAAAAAIQAQSAGKAVELSEAGRAVLWTGVLDRRGDLARVAAAAPAPARELPRVRREQDA